MRKNISEIIFGVFFIGMIVLGIVLAPIQCFIFHSHYFAHSRNVTIDNLRVVYLFWINWFSFIFIYYLLKKSSNTCYVWVIVLIVHLLIILGYICPDLVLS